MATKISIKNFQSIKKIDFNIDGFTVIIGKNNIGKSAVIRSIEAALTNQTGKEYIRHGEKSTEVKIKRDGLDIAWEKGVSAKYKINKETYSKLNRAIPQPLIKAGFDKMDIGGQKISPLIASQFNALFLIDENGGTITEVLAALYKIDTLSIADDLCQKSLRSQKSLKKTREKDLKDVQDSLKKYGNFEEVKKIIDDLFKRNAEAEEKKKELEQLIQFEQKYIRLNKEIKTLQPFKKVTVPAIKGIEQKAVEVQGLRIDTQEYIRLSSAVKGLKKISGIRIPVSSKLEDNISEVKWLINNTANIHNIAKEFKRFKKAYTIKIPDLSKFENELSKVLRLKKWHEGIAQLTTQIKKQEVYLKSDNTPRLQKCLKKVIRLKEGLNDILEIETPFMGFAKQTKEMREKVSLVSDELKAVQKEFAKFKICPTCEQPL